MSFASPAWLAALALLAPALWLYVRGERAGRRGRAAFATPAEWRTWFTGQAGEMAVEDGSFVKWRELALSYTFDQPVVSRFTGFSTVDLRLAGRNLITWTDYSGFDPESSIQGAVIATQGSDIFNTPSARSFVVSVTLVR